MQRVLPRIKYLDTPYKLEKNVGLVWMLAHVVTRTTHRVHCAAGTWCSNGLSWTALCIPSGYASQLVPGNILVGVGRRGRSRGPVRPNPRV